MVKLLVFSYCVAILANNPVRSEDALTIQSPGEHQVYQPNSKQITVDEATLSLAGTWRFRLDPDNIGVEQAWFAQELDDTVILPGTSDENHKGVFKDERSVDRLSRIWYWKGPTWYQRRVKIPETWKGKRITLLLERTKYTRVWVDRTFCAWEDTLSAPRSSM
jgi:beta-galactosidase/beta-glucuronidase